MSSRFPGIVAGSMAQGLRAEKQVRLNERQVGIQERGQDLREKQFEAAQKKEATDRIKALEAGIVDGIGKLSSAFDKGVIETNQMQALKTALALQITAMRNLSPEGAIKAQKLEEKVKKTIEGFTLKGKETAAAAGTRQKAAATAAGGITAAAGRASAAATAAGQLDVSRTRETRLAKAAKKKAEQPATLPASMANSIRTEAVTALGGQVDFKTGMIIGIDQNLLLRVNEITSLASSLLLAGRASSPATAVQLAIRTLNIQTAPATGGGTSGVGPRAPIK